MVVRNLASLPLSLIDSGYKEQSVAELVSIIH